MVVAISAPEPSGRLVAEALCAGLATKSRVHHLSAARRLGPIMGFVAGFASTPRVAAALREAKHELSAAQPDVVALISFPGFHLQLGRWCRRRGIRTVMIGPPQFWAWGSFRLNHLRGAVDQVVCMFAFEEEPIRRAGIEAYYFGHPLLDIVRATESRTETLQRLGLAPDDRYVVLVPGSRPAERAFHEPLYAGAFSKLRGITAEGQGGRHLSGLRGVMLAPPGPGLSWTTHPATDAQALLASPLPELPEGLVWNADQRYDILAHAECAAICSGTATLEAAILGVPMTVSYHLPLLDRLLAKALLRTRFFALPNIVAGRPVVAEFLEPTAEAIASELLSLLALNTEGSPRRARIKKELAEVAEMLEPHGAIESIVNLLTRRVCS